MWCNYNNYKILYRYPVERVYMNDISPFFFFFKTQFFRLLFLKLVPKVKQPVDNITMSYFGRGFVGGNF